MRITDERYHRDRLRYDLALRMIRHEARTCTIRSWTGLSGDRIRRLFKAYVEHEHPAPVRRHRGKPPRQAGYFLRTGSTQLEGTLLATIFGACGLLAMAHATPGRYGLEFGTRFCDAYETYLLNCRDQPVSFEHAWLLLKALVANEEICLAVCTRCTGPFVRDLFAVGPLTCPLCRLKRPRAARMPRRDLSQPALMAQLAEQRESGDRATEC